jgi:hypothetical protein
MSDMSQIGRRQALLGGVGVIALGAWGATASAVVGGDGFWEWTLDRELLALLPGAAAVLGGLGMIGGRRRSVRWGGLLALAGGVWFMVGALTSPLWAAGTPALGGTELRMLQWVVFYLGTGAMITVLSSYGLGLLDGQPVVEEPTRPPGRDGSACERRRRPGVVTLWAARRQRPHAGARTHGHRRS